MTSSKRKHPHIYQMMVMFARSSFIILLGTGWWIAAPVIFLHILPSFSLYNQWLANYRTDQYSVYLFWQVLPEIILFPVGIFWASGLFELIGKVLSQKIH